MSDPAAGVAERLARLRARRSVDAIERCLAVRDLVVVCSSSRGGSTAFGELLRAHPALLGFSAEINPHVAVATLGSGGGCDLLADPTPVAGSAEGLAILRAELGADLGRDAPSVLDDDRTAFADHVAWRLALQWPREPIDADAVRVWVEEALAESVPFDRDGVLLALLRRVMARHPTVDPRRYDLPADRVRHLVPPAPPPAGPTDEPVLEMAPFVVPRPWRAADPGEVARRTVVTSTPRNAFRVPLLRRAFPNARVRVVHLTRNPAAAINGLRDGWRHHGFFSCRTDVQLSIDGYAGPWADRWWNFDVPPGWRGWVERPLVEVCGFQWRAAHVATIDAAADGGLDAHRIAFEDIVGPPERRLPALHRLAAWLGIDPAPLVTGTHTLPVVMSTAPPRPGRWRHSAGVLAPVVTDRATLELAEELGYGRDPDGWT